MAADTPTLLTMSPEEWQTAAMVAAEMVLLNPTSRAEMLTTLMQEVRALSAALDARTAERDEARKELVDFRNRAYFASSATVHHSTACLTWGDDGQGHTREGHETHHAAGLKCNCGAWANWQIERAERAEAQVTALRETLERVRDIYDHSAPQPPGGQHVGPPKYSMNVSTRKQLKWALDTAPASPEAHAAEDGTPPPVRPLAVDSSTPTPFVTVAEMVSAAEQRGADRVLALVRELRDNWWRNADMLADETEGRKHGDAGAGMQYACANALNGLLTEAEAETPAPGGQG